METTLTAPSRCTESANGYTNTDEYMFVFTDINPADDGVRWRFNLSIDGGSNYNVTKTTTFFQATHSEADATSFGYHTSFDLAESTSHQPLMVGIGNGSDESGCGCLHLFSPSSTTYVKHFYSTISHYHQANGEYNNFISGYGNTTSAIDAIQFNADGGNFDGLIQMYGIA